MYGMARHRLFAVLGAVVAVVNVGLSIALAFPLGIYGVAIGTVVPMLCIRDLYLYSYLPGLARMGMWRYVASVWAKPLLGLGPLAAVLTVLRFVLAFDRLLWIMVFFAAVGGLYVLWVFLVVLTPEERRLLPGLSGRMATPPAVEEHES
jgi:hypothetical protein